MLSVNDTIILTGKVRNKAVAKNQLATARVADKIGSELKTLDPRSYQTKAYMASVVPKLQMLDKALG
jgi:hypothetical protein